MYNQNPYASQYQGQGEGYKNPPGGVPANYVPPPTLTPYQGQPMVVQGQQQPQVIVVQQPSLSLYRPPVYEGLPLGQLRVSGILQIIVGSFAFLINIMARVTTASYSAVGIGFWGGIFFIVAGSLGIAASSRPTKPSVTAAAALAIIAGVLACIMIGLSAGGISSDVAYGTSFYYYYYSYTDPEGWYNAAIAANAILLILGAVQLGLTLWQAVISFTALCNKTPVAPAPLTVPGVQVVTQTQQQYYAAMVTSPSTSTYPPYSAAASQPPPYNPHYENKVTD